MGAGISPKAMNAQLRRSLERTRLELARAGIPADRKGIELSGVFAGHRWRVDYSILRASNGETAAIPRLAVAGAVTEFGCGTMAENITRVLCALPAPARAVH